MNANRKTHHFYFRDSKPLLSKICQQEKQTVKSYRGYNAIYMNF